MSTSAQKYLVNALLILSVSAVYWQVLEFEFINLDDDQYVTANAHVRAGLTAQGFVWAFSEFSSFNWHPLTWLSHMLDVQLFGLNDGAHHATNVLLHLVNGLLLFSVLRACTRKLWPSAVVAALFALHPAHVESVVWVSERKDVLSTLFLLLTLHAYIRYGAGTSPRKMALVMLFFALGLLSKPMLVTLPFLLLLLDVWPLNRLRLDEPNIARQFAHLLKEKLPLFGLTLVSSLVTFWAQSSGGAMKAGEVIPFSIRVDNALISYVRYLVKLVYPDNLAIYYPHPGGWDGLLVVSSVGLLVAITGWVLWRVKPQPYLAVGWFWFVGTLVPVIGLVQVGSQAMADRYTYVPYIGLFVAVVWAGSEWFDRSGKLVRRAQATAAIVLIGVYALLSFQYASQWKNTVSVFSHALIATDDAYLALVGRGPAPKNPSTPKHNGLYTPYYNLGTAYAEAGLYSQARVHLETAIKAHAGFPEAYINMGVVLAQVGDLQGSANYYRRALEVDSGNELAAKNLGLVLQMLEE
jgi:hypothetical protein